MQPTGGCEEFGRLTKEILNFMIRNTVYFFTATRRWSMCFSIDHKHSKKKMQKLKAQWKRVNKWIFQKACVAVSPFRLFSLLLAHNSKRVRRFQRQIHEKHEDINTFFYTATVQLNEKRRWPTAKALSSTTPFPCTALFLNANKSNVIPD